MDRISPLGAGGEAVLLGETGEEHAVGIVADALDPLSTPAAHEQLPYCADQVELLDGCEFHVKRLLCSGGVSPPSV